MEFRGDITRCVLPPCQGVLSFSSTSPAALHCARSLASAGRMMSRRSCSSGLRQPTAPIDWSVSSNNLGRATATAGANFATLSPKMRDWNQGLPAFAACRRDDQRFWPNRGVDGFRFGDVGNLFEDGPSAWLDRVAELQADGPDAGACGELPAARSCLGSPHDLLGCGAASACGRAFSLRARHQWRTGGFGQGRCWRERGGPPMVVTLVVMAMKSR
jgi:hypothetical protein